MIEFIITLLFFGLFYAAFAVFPQISKNLKNMNEPCSDNRDVEEKIIAGEDTSEVARNFLKKL